MPFHPAAPDDVAGLLDAYGHTMRAIIDLGRSTRDADFARDTECPGWTVKDVIAHVAGLEGWLAGGDIPHIDVPAYDHIKNDVGRFTEIAVEAHRGTPPQDVVDELEEVMGLRQAQLYAADLSMDSIIVGSFGPAEARTVLGMRLVDIWTHEQDIRGALGRPGNLDSPAAAVAVERFAMVVPRVVARTAAVPPGNTVIFDLTGPVVGRVGARVEDHDGKAIGVPLFTGDAAHADGGDGESATTSITLSTQAFARRAAGRGSVEDIHVTIHGDEDIARRVLEALPSTF